MIHDTETAQILPKQDGRNLCEAKKANCPTAYHHNGFLVPHSTWAHDDVLLHIAGSKTRSVK